MIHKRRNERPCPFGRIMRSTLNTLKKYLSANVCTSASRVDLRGQVGVVGVEGIA